MSISGLNQMDEHEFEFIEVADVNFIQITKDFKTKKRFWSGAHNIVIEKGVFIGEGTILRRGVVIGNKVRIGRCCHIGNNSLIRDGVTLGKGVSIGFSNSIEPGAKIGDYTKTQGFCMISEGSRIGNDCFLGPHFNNPADKTIGSPGKVYVPDPAKIGNGVRFGSNVKLKPGIKIGDNSIIGMGSLVTKNVGEGETWYGFPAKKVLK